MDCKVTKEYLGRAAGGLLNFLRGNKIESVKDLDKFAEKEFSINKENREKIMTSLSPSEFGTRAYTISYIAEGTEEDYNRGIVLELRINTGLDYSLIIAKNKSPLKGYDPFAKDPFDNLIQSKRLAADFSEIKSELSNLVA